MSTAEYRITLIRERINTELNPSYLNIIDQSADHAGHPEAQTQGGGHFTIEVISPLFADKTAIERHRMIYLALGDAMGKEIHAVSITAETPSENQAKAPSSSQ